MASNRVREYYDSTASTYGIERGGIYPTFLKQKLLQEFAREGSACLDIGIANGLHAWPLSKIAGRVFGLDISREMLKQARERADEKGNLDVIQASARDVPLEGKQFDLVYSFSTLLFVPDAEQALAEAFRVLKPGGLAILDITGTFNLSQAYWTMYYRKRGHERLSHFTLPNVKKLLAELGFEIKQIHSTGILDQWKYIPLVRHFVFLNRVFHSQNGRADFDYWMSQLLPGLANRWYFVLKKPNVPTPE